MADKITILLKEPGKPAEAIRIPDTLKAFQGVVGGYIECVHPFRQRNMVLVVNEEGMLEGLPAQYIRTVADEDLYQRFFGTIFLCAEDEKDPSQFRGLTEEEIIRHRPLMNLEMEPDT